MTIRTVRVDEHTSITTQLCIWSCPTCGIVYGIPATFADDCRSSGKSYYCPNGHTLSWRDTDADKQRKRAERAEKDRDYWQKEERRMREEKTSAEHRERAQKAAKTKLKNRIAKGVCPCCNRHFVNVERHMQTKHPEFATDAKGAADGDR